MDLNNYIKVYDNFLPVQTVSSLIIWSNNICFEEATIGKGDVKKDIRDAEIFSLTTINKGDSKTKIHWSNLLGKFFFEKFLEYSNEVFTIRKEFVARKLLDLGILKYKKNGKYVPHVDHCLENPRTLSAILFLNNDYEGGNLNFYSPDGTIIKKIYPNPGKLVIWPSTFLYPHSVEPVTKGVRYTIVSWAI